MKNGCVKILICTMLLVTVLVFPACQPTPEQPVVVNKNDGKLEEAMHESAAPVKPYEVPAHWSETVDDKKFKIVIDADIVMPDVNKYPVVKLEAAKFTQQRVDELVGYFAKGKKLYLPSVKTKADYQDEIIEAKRGQLVDGEYVVDEGTLDWVEELENMQASAPDESPKVYTDTTLTYYKQSTGEEVLGSGRNFLDVMIENSDGDDASISVGNYAAGYNLSASFSYSAHPDLDYITETRYRNAMEFGENEDDSYWADIKQLFDEVVITREQAEAQAQKVIEDLGIKDMALVRADKAVLPGEPDKGGYDLRYMRESGGIPAFMFEGGGSWSEGEKPPEYSPPFEEEHIDILVTKEGVIRIAWQGCAEVVENVSENVELLPFDNIQQDLKDQVFYKNSFLLGMHGMQDFETTVTSAELRMGYIGVKDSVNQELMVPVWVFGTNTSCYNTTTKKRQSWGDGVFVFNAIDGGVVEMGRLDNILC